VKNDDAGFDASPRDVGSEGIGKNQPQNHQQQDHLSGAAWYDQQAHRAVNQAVGRTIRHRTDYGAILLLDSRFADARNRKGMSKWVRPYIQEDQGMGKNVGSWGRFFEAAREMKEKERAEATGKSGTIHPEYEEKQAAGEGLGTNDERGEDEITRVAVVRAKTSSSEQGRGGGNNGGPDDDLSRGFVRPDLVLTRLDMKDCRGTEDGGLVDSLEDTEATTNVVLDETSSGLESLYSANRGSKHPHRHASSLNMAAASSSNNHNNDSVRGAFSSLQAVERPSNPYHTSKAKVPGLSAIDGKDQSAGTKRKHPAKGEETSDSSVQRVRSNSSSSRGSSIANGAKKFFDAARTALSVDDFTSVRRRRLCQ